LIKRNFLRRRQALWRQADTTSNRQADKQERSEEGKDVQSAVIGGQNWGCMREGKVPSKFEEPETEGSQAARQARTRD